MAGFDARNTNSFPQETIWKGVDNPFIVNFISKNGAILSMQ
jgi:hypothetical protein